MHNGGQFQPWNRLQHSYNIIRRVMKIKIITEVTYCGFTLYCMFKALTVCLPMTFHSLPGTDSEVGEYASTHDHIGQLCSLLQDWCKVFNEPLVLNLAAYLRSRDWVCAMCIYNFIPCFNAVLSLSDHCCYIVRW